jgi:hypothetical protein
LFLATSLLLGGQATKPETIETSCRTFLQSFYKWYLPKGSQETGGRSWNDIVKYKRAAFGAELFRQLKIDFDAAAKNKEEIVALDFDPFLASQDPCERYVVGNITAKGNNYLVEVYGVCSGKRNKRVDVTPEVSFKDGQWTFVNFHYGKGKGEDLLSILKALRDEREKSPVYSCETSSWNNLRQYIF